MKVLSIEHALELAQRRSASRDDFIAKTRLILRLLVAESIGYEPFEHGTFYGQIAHELLAIRAENGDPLAAERRIRRNKKISPSTRKRVLLRDGYRCQECGFSLPPDEEERRRLYQEGRYLTIDHVIPLSEGGANRAENMRTLCRSCNAAKGKALPTRSPSGLLAQPEEQGPFKPTDAGSKPAQPINRRGAV